MKRTEITKLDMFLGVMQGGISYNFVEFGFILLFVAMELILGAIWMPALWFAAALTVVWILLSSTRDAEDEAERLLLDHEIFVSDFMIGALFMLVLSVLASAYGLSFGIVFFVAAIQNLRYTALCLNCLVELRRVKEKREQQEREQRDNLPEV